MHEPIHAVTSGLRIARAWARFLLLPLLFFIFVRVFVLDAFTIPTSSMENTLLVGDFLFVNKMVYGSEVPWSGMKLPAGRDPWRGEVVVFRPPHDSQRVYVKRVVGIPGDTLEMREKTLILNSEPQEEPFALHADERRDAIHPGMSWQSDFLVAAPRRRYVPSRDNWGPLVVPAGKFFVLGDNRDNSEDSRYWGFVDREDIRGKPWIVYLSLGMGEGGKGGWLQKVRWDRVGSRVR